MLKIERTCIDAEQLLGGQDGAPSTGAAGAQCYHRADLVGQREVDGCRDRDLALRSRCSTDSVLTCQIAVGPLVLFDVWTHQ